MAPCPVAVRSCPARLVSGSLVSSRDYFGVGWRSIEGWTALTGDQEGRTVTFCSQGRRGPVEVTDAPRRASGLPAGPGRLGVWLLRASSGRPSRGVLPFGRGIRSHGHVRRTALPLSDRNPSGAPVQRGEHRPHMASVPIRTSWKRAVYVARLNIRTPASHRVEAQRLIPYRDLECEMTGLFSILVAVSGYAYPRGGGGCR